MGRMRRVGICDNRLAGSFSSVPYVSSVPFFDPCLFSGALFRPDQLDQALLNGSVEVDLDQDQLPPGKAEREQMSGELALGKFVDFDQNQTSLIQDHQPGFYVVNWKREPAEASAL
jgi:hypothetical protein